jgi:hypothetical protein
VTVFGQAGKALAQHFDAPMTDPEATHGCMGGRSQLLQVAV